MSLGLNELNNGLAPCHGICRLSNDQVCVAYLLVLKGHFSIKKFYQYGKFLYSLIIIMFSLKYGWSLYWNMDGLYIEIWFCLKLKYGFAVYWYGQYLFIFKYGFALYWNMDGIYIDIWVVFILKYGFALYWNMGGIYIKIQLCEIQYHHMVTHNDWSTWFACQLNANMARLAHWYAYRITTGGLV